MGEWDNIIKDLNENFVQTILDGLTGSIEENTEMLRNDYKRMISGCILEKQRQQLEVMFFRSCFYQAYIKGVCKIHDKIDYKQFLSDDDYYMGNKMLLYSLMMASAGELGEQYQKKGEQLLKEGNTKEAVEAFLESATSGRADGQYDVAVAVSRGEGGLKEDPLEAAFWYWLSATNGYEKAMINLGAAYGSGVGVGKNSCQAVYWYAMAAQKCTYPVAVYNLGYCLKNQEINLGANTCAMGQALIQASDDIANNVDGIKKLASRIIEVLEPVVYNNK